jgi:hypothetical protein
MYSSVSLSLALSFCLVSYLVSCLVFFACLVSCLVFVACLVLLLALSFCLAPLCKHYLSTLLLLRGDFFLAPRTKNLGTGPPPATEGPSFSVSLSCLVLSCLVLSCLVLSCLVLSCLVLSCLVLYCLVLSCRVVSCRGVACREVACRVVSCHVLCCLVLATYPEFPHFWRQGLQPLHLFIVWSIDNVL